MVYLKRLVASFSTRRSRLNPRAVHVGFVVCKVDWIRFFSKYLGFPLPIFIPLELSFFPVIRGWHNRPPCDLSTKGVSTHLKNKNVNYLLLSTYIILSIRALHLNILCLTGTSVRKKILLSKLFILQLWGWRRYVPPKRDLTFNRLDGVIFQKTILKIFNFSLWSSGQSSWLQILRSRVRFPVIPDFLRSSGSGTGSTQPREDNWGATWMEK
jgi:hypothetical protein